MGYQQFTVKPFRKNGHNEQLFFKIVDIKWEINESLYS